MRTLRLILILPVFVLTLSWASAADQLAPWGANHHATDVPKQHVEQIADGQRAYTVRHGGTMDGTNCRSPMGCGMNREGAIEQSWHCLLYTSPSPRDS